MEDLLKRIGINKEGNYSKSGAYVIDIESSDEFGVIYTLLDKSDEIEELTDNGQVTEHTANIGYTSDDYLLNLQADYDNDTYKLIVTKLKEKEED